MGGSGTVDKPRQVTTAILTAVLPAHDERHEREVLNKAADDHERRARDFLSSQQGYTNNMLIARALRARAGNGGGDE
jgi:hypothetical protein